MITIATSPCKTLDSTCPIYQNPHVAPLPFDNALAQRSQPHNGSPPVASRELLELQVIEHSVHDMYNGSTPPAYTPTNCCHTAIMHKACFTPLACSPLTRSSVGSAHGRVQHMHMQNPAAAAADTGLGLPAGAVPAAHHAMHAPGADPVVHCAHMAQAARPHACMPFLTLAAVHVLLRMCHAPNKRTTQPHPAPVKIPQQCSHITANI